MSIEVNEIQGAGGSSGLRFGSLVKAQTITSSDIQRAIQAAVGTIKETNQFLDLSLLAINQREIPVDVSVVHFAYRSGDEAGNAEIKFDFGIFDLDGNGNEACTGCTCPLGCAPELAECPKEVPEDELRPICFRVWLNGKRFMAGVFDRVPTADNPQSGRMRVVIPDTADLGGSNLGIVYDHQDPQNLSTDLAFFEKDSGGASETFFSRRRSLITQVGPEAQSKKTPLLSLDRLDNSGSFFLQAQYFTHLDFIALESVANGIFESELGLVDITPPICAQISSSDPVAQVLCDDLGLVLSPGNFPTLPELQEVSLPPPDQFPESPTF